MKRALLIKNREYNGICTDFVLSKLMGNRDSIENHRQSRKEIVSPTGCRNNNSACTVKISHKKVIITVILGIL